MRIGLYGMPCSGKSYLLEKVQECTWNQYTIFGGSGLLFGDVVDVTHFRGLSSGEKVTRRKQLALKMKEQDDFIMDGHYSFGDEVVFTEVDGGLYDVFCYLYLPPEILTQRMEQSEKNRKYLAYDLEDWQQREISALRRHCHQENKDFYVLDCPESPTFPDLSLPLAFLNAIQQGYSVVASAREKVRDILSKGEPDTKNMTLCDGDKTLTLEDTSQRMFNVRTSLFDGNFYTGYQQWQQYQLFSTLEEGALDLIPQMKIRQNVLDRWKGAAVIVTSGHGEVWERFSLRLGVPCICGEWMCADSKFFLVKFLQEAGLTITGFGDSMNDYYMLQQADMGYLVRNQKGEVSRSLDSVSLEGLHYV